MNRYSLVLLSLFLVACPEPAGPADAGAGVEVDASTLLDAGTEDGGTTDAGASEDAGSAARIGTLSGDCGEIDSEDLLAPAPQLLRNAIDFGDRGFVQEALTAGGAEVLADGNLGGSSLHSEVISHEVLALCDRAELLKTEAEIDYRDAGGKKTDLLLRIDEQIVGVSVTRAVGWPREGPYPAEQAQALLEDKLADVLLANDNVTEADAWTKQILHIIAFAPDHADRIVEAFEQIDAAVQGDTIVLVTVTDGDDDFLY